MGGCLSRRLSDENTGGHKHRRVRFIILLAYLRGIQYTALATILGCRFMCGEGSISPGTRCDTTGNSYVALVPSSNRHQLLIHDHELFVHTQP
jgi:hypothetical protein